MKTKTEMQQRRRQIQLAITDMVVSLRRKARSYGISEQELNQMLHTHFGGLSADEAHMDRFRRNLPDLAYDAFDAARSLKGIGGSSD